MNGGLTVPRGDHIEKMESIGIRLTAAEKAALQKAAAEKGMTLSQYIRSRLFISIVLPRT